MKVSSLTLLASGMCCTDTSAMVHIPLCILATSVFDTVFANCPAEDRFGWIHSHVLEAETQIAMNTSVQHSARCTDSPLNIFQS